jgi:hypothetical protein
MLTEYLNEFVLFCNTGNQNVLCINLFYTNIEQIMLNGIFILQHSYTYWKQQMRFYLTNENQNS